MTDYARHEHHDFLEASRQALANPPLQAALIRLTSTLMAGNRRGYAALADSSELRDHAKRIKEHTLAHLDRYLEQLEASVQRLGGQVHWAATAEDARRIVVEIARQTNSKRIVKSKSMTTEEVHLNPALEAAGLEVTETDFGEFIIQLAGERPSHLVAPAVHHTRESIARILSAHTGETLPDDPAAAGEGGPAAAAREVRRRRHGHHRGELRRRRDGHRGAGHQRGQRPADDDLPARPRRADGHGEGHSPAGSTCRCS